MPQCLISLAERCLKSHFVSLGETHGRSLLQFPTNLTPTIVISPGVVHIFSVVQLNSSTLNSTPHGA